LFLTVAILLGAMRWRGASQSAGLKPIADRKPMADLALPQIDGGEWKLADHRGQVVLINYWATWCEPCQDELPGLLQVARESGPQGLAVVGVSLDSMPGERTQVEQFAARFKLPYPIAYAGTSAMQPREFEIPTTVLIDRQGRTAKVYVGEAGRANLQADVDALLAES
jgi:peroxiredoxin